MSSENVLFGFFKFPFIFISENQSHLSSVNHPQKLKAIQVNTVVILPIKAVAFPVSLLLHF